MTDQTFIDKFITIGGAVELMKVKKPNSIEQYLKQGKIDCVYVKNATGKRLTRLFYISQLVALREILDFKAKGKAD